MLSGLALASPPRRIAHGARQVFKAFRVLSTLISAKRGGRSRLGRVGTKNKKPRSYTLACTIGNPVGLIALESAQEMPPNVRAAFKGILYVCSLCTAKQCVLLTLTRCSS